MSKRDPQALLITLGQRGSWQCSDFETLIPGRRAEFYSPRTPKTKIAVARTIKVWEPFPDICSIVWEGEIESIPAQSMGELLSFIVIAVKPMLQRDTACVYFFSAQSGFFWQEVSKHE